MSSFRRRLMMSALGGEDKYILDVQTESNRIKFGVNAGPKGVVVIFDNEPPQIVPPNSYKLIEFIFEESRRGLISFRGDIVKVVPYTQGAISGNGAEVVIKGIVKWYSKLDHTFANQFRSAGGDGAYYDIIIPKTIKKIVANTFQYRWAISGTNLVIHDNIKEIATISDLDSNGYTTSFYSNAILDGGVWYLNNYAVCTYSFKGATEVASYTLKQGTRMLANGLFAGYTLVESFTLNNDGSLWYIGSETFAKSNNAAFTTLTIPSSVRHIGNLAFANSDGSMSLTTMRFEIPADVNVRIPTAGASGMLKAKTARNMTIYADHPHLRGYNFGEDNITVTMLSLDGNAVLKTDTPTISLLGSTTAVTLSGEVLEYYYKYTGPSAVLGTTLISTSSIIDWDDILTIDGSHTITVKAAVSGKTMSDSSETITYVKGEVQ